MATLTTAQADITINDGPSWPGTLHVEQEIITYRSLSATRPDPRWTMVDAAGHYHAYDDDGELPTLAGERKHVDCDGVHLGPMLDPEQPCEGYDITEWHCRICGEQIKPGRLPDTDEKAMPGLRSWRAEIVTDRPIDNGMVFVRVLTADSLCFGHAAASTRLVEQQFDGGLRVVVELVGATALGHRSHR